MHCFNLKPDLHLFCAILFAYRMMNEGVGVTVVYVIVISRWYSAGAILANGRGGRKTTLWTEQNKFFVKKFVILCLQTNLTQWFNWSFWIKTAGRVLWSGYWTYCEYKLRKMVRKCIEVWCLGITPTLRLISRMAPG